VPTAQSSSVNTAFQTPVGVSLIGEDSDGSIASRTVTVAPQNGVVSGNGVNRTYTPNSGFSGNDSFSFIVTDNQGESSPAATVSITVAEAVVPSVSITGPSANTELTIGSNFNLSFNLSNAAAVNVSVDGTLVAGNVASSPVSLTAPSTPGAFVIEVSALDASGSALGVADSVSLTATEMIMNMAPIASFTSTASGLTAGFNAAGSSDPDNGPQALSYAWDFGDGTNGTGVSPSHTYASQGTYSVTLTVSDGEDIDTSTASVTVMASQGGVLCEYLIDNEWNSGFVAKVKLSNNGTSAVNGWTVSWQYAPGTSLNNSWNATLSGNNPYTATNLPWNASIQPGQSVEFGIQGGKSGGSADIPTISGDVCQ